MTEIALRPAIPAMSPAAIGNVARLEEMVLALPQVPMETDHVLHAGLYARTLKIPAGVVLTGALIKIATVLIVQGDAIVYVGADGEQAKHLTGYNVLPAAAGRKQAFFAQTDVHLTMIFPTQAKIVEEAEREFTDEAHRLGSRRPEGINTVTVKED